MLKNILPKLFFFIFILSACDVPADKVSQPSSKKDSLNVASGTWKYSENVDEMTSKKEHFATLHTKDHYFFGYYQANNWKKRYSIWPSIVIQNIDNKNSVLIEVNDTLMPELNGNFYGDNITVRFDSLAPVKFQIALPDDGSTDAVFVEPAKRFIDRLKRSKSVLIKAAFTKNVVKTESKGGYRNLIRTSVGTGYVSHDTKIIKFDVQGLKWNYK